MRALAMVALLACGNDTSGASIRVPDCGAKQPAVLTDSGVGALRIGTPIDSLQPRCMVLWDTTLVSGAEGMRERRLTLLVGSAATTITVAEGKVWRIEVTSPRFRTRDSLGVGTSLGWLKSRGGKMAGSQQTPFVMLPHHCGLSFQLATPSPSARGMLSDSAVVDLVLVTGC